MPSQQFVAYGLAMENRIKSVWLQEINDAIFGSALGRSLSARISDRVNVLEYIPVALHAGIFAGTNTTALHTYIQAAITASKAAGKGVHLPGWTYLIGGKITNLTDDSLASNPHNGIQLFGELGTVFKAAAGFPAGEAMLDLDGNTSNATTTASAKTQQYNRIEGIEFDGSDVAQRGLRLRANNYCAYRDLYFHDFAGDGDDAVIFFHSSADAGQDDTDTTGSSVFENIRIDGGMGYGVWAATSRTAATVFSNVDIRNCAYDGMRISYAGLLLLNVTLASNGSVVSSTVGGLSIVTSGTKAINRGLVAIELHSEANYNHEVNVDQAAGFLFLGGNLTPYISAATIQDVMRFGVEATSGLVTDGKVEGMRIANYASGGHSITGMQVGSAAVNIDFERISFYTGTTDSWNTQAEQYSIHALAGGITVDGAAVSGRPTRPMFLSTANISGTASPNVTGDGTEYSSAVYWALSGAPDTYNSGPITNSFSITASIAGTSLTVTAVTGTPIWPGMSLADLGLGIGASAAPPDVLPNTYITAFIGGSGGIGTYEVNKSQTVASRGMYLQDTQPYKAGIFTAPRPGPYRFYIAWPCTGFNGAETDVEVAFIKNPGGSQVRHVAYKRRPDATLNAAAINIYSAESAPLYLARGDTVVGTIKISGGALGVDIYKNIPAPGGWVFSGQAV